LYVLYILAREKENTRGQIDVRSLNKIDTTETKKHLFSTSEKITLVSIRWRGRAREDFLLGAFVDTR